MNALAILNFLNKQKNLSKQKQIKYLERFNPKDDIERSYFQYKCQAKLNKGFANFILNLLSIPLLLNLSLKKNTPIEEKKYTRVLVYVHDLENVPPSLRENSLFLEELSPILKDETTKAIARKLKKKYFWSFYFRAKVLSKLYSYNYLLSAHKPQEIVTSNEYSFTSSILTNFCESKGIKHIDVMHGEKTFCIYDAYFRFSKIYAWDQSYIDLFNELKASCENHEFYIPKGRFCIDTKKEKEYQLTIYLQEQNKKEMKRLADVLDNYKHLKISIRPHPRYTNMKYCKEVFSHFNVEDCSKVSCEESIARTENVCSLFSTVLLQAKYSNVPFCIDDISMKNKYDYLKELDYPYVVNSPSLTEFLKDK